MAKGVTPLTRGMHKATRPIMKDKWNSDELARQQMAQDQKRYLRPKASGKDGSFKGSPTGSNDTYQ